MRKSLIFAPLAFVGLAVGAAGSVQAGSVAPQTPAPTIPLPNFETVMSVLTPEQLTCIAESVGTADISADPAAAMTALTDCGVSMDQLMEIAGGMTAGPSDSAVGTTPAPDAATITAVLDLIGLDATELACLAASATGAPADDAAALTVLQTCEISLAELLNGIVAANAGGATGAVTVPGVSTPGAGGSGLADIFIQQFAAQGMTLTPEQATCIGDEVLGGGIDPATIGTDLTALTALLDTCGIELADLIGG